MENKLKLIIIFYSIKNKGSNNYWLIEILKLILK